LAVVVEVVVQPVLLHQLEWVAVVVLVDLFKSSWPLWVPVLLQLQLAAQAQRALVRALLVEQEAIPPLMMELQPTLLLVA
jgi:hypothetical protein